MKVLIVGAGIAGLTLAAYLRKQGIEPTIVEKAMTLKPFGYAIGIFPRGVRILKEVGAYKFLKNRSSKIGSYHIKDYDGSLLFSLQLKKDVGTVQEMQRANLYKSL